MNNKINFLLNAINKSLLIGKKEKKSSFYYFFDILIFRIKFYGTINNYMEHEYYSRNKEQRKLVNAETLALKKYEKRRKRDQYIFSKYFLPKPGIKFTMKRNNDYIKTYNMGEGCHIGHNVLIKCEHKIMSNTFICRSNVRISRNSDIDYTGGIEIGNGVSIREGVKILTHGHDELGLKSDIFLTDKKNRIWLSKLLIEDNVNIAVHAIIMPGVGRIGENSIISAGAVVRKKVPSNVIVSGNPAEVVFEFPPERRLLKKYNND